MSSRTHHITIITILVTLLMLVPLLSFAAESAGWVESWLWAIVVSFFGRIMVGLTGLALDWGVNNYIIGFGKEFLTTGVGGAVDILWVAVRDIFNITFIFGLVFIGFKMILNSDDPGTRRWLVSLIMAALLVNFSLYITKTVVDFSNIAATQIAKGFPPDKNGGVSISYSFMDTFGIQSVLDTKYSLPTTNSTGASFAYIFGTMILFIVTAFVFGSGAILLFIRFAVLCLYMVLSPLMFLSWVFPQMSSITSKYWHGFLGRAFFAPIYLLLIYFSIYILNAWKAVMVQNGKGDPNYPEVFAGMGDATLNSFEQTIPPLILGCIFMLASVVIANKMGADGASTLISMGKRAQGGTQRYLQRQAIRATKATAANTAGRGARRLSYATGAALDKQISRMQNAREGSLARKIGNSVFVDDVRKGTAKNMQNAKFGMKYSRPEEQQRRDEINKRATANDVNAAGTVARENLQLHTEHDALVAAGTTAAQRLQTESFTGPQGLQEREDLEAQVAEMNKAAALRAEMNDIASDNPDMTIEKQVEAWHKAEAKMQSQVGNLTNEQLERMFTERTDDFESIVGQLKGGQFDAMVNSKNLTQEQKDRLVELRTDALKKAVTKNGEVSVKDLEKLTAKQLENLGDDFIRDNAHLLTQKQVDEIVKSDNFTDWQKGEYLESRKSTISNNLAAKMTKDDQGNDVPESLEKYKARTKTYFERKPAEFAASVSFDDLKDNDHAISSLKAGHLEELHKKLTPEQRKQLMNKVKASGSEDAKEYLNTYNGARNWNNTEALNPQQPAAQPPQPPQNQNRNLPPPPPGYTYDATGTLVPINMR